MQKILRRLAKDSDDEEQESDQQQDSDDENADIRFWHEMLERLAKDDPKAFPIVLASLPDKVRADFERAVQDGRLSNAIDRWEAWWEPPICITPLPITVPSLPPINALSSAAPSPLLAYGVVDLLFAYSVMMRLWQGDWHDDAQDAASTVLQLSALLNSKQPHESVSAAMEAVAERAVRHSVLSRVAVVAAMGDVPLLLQRHDYALAGLADLHELFASILRENSNNKNKDKDKATNKDANKQHTLTCHERKLYFHLVYLNSLSPLELLPLASAASAVHSKQLKDQTAASASRAP